MEERISVLLLQNQPDPLRALNQALRVQSVKTTEARTCQEALQLLGGPNPPELVFTDTDLPDGSWADVVRWAEKAASPVNVIVVLRFADVRFYVGAIENGAFDVIVPPFEPSELAHVVRCAAGNVAARRRIQKPAASA